MDKEELLKNYILSKYKSLLEFTQRCDIPYGTLQGVLKRGISNSSLTTIMKICHELEISVDALAIGKIVPIDRYKKTEHLEDMIREFSLRVENYNITLGGIHLDKSEKEKLLFLLQTGMEMIRSDRTK